MEEFASQGLSVLGFFQSPAASVEKYVMPLDPPFPLVADPQREVYRLYGVRTSWAGYFKAGLRWGAIRDAFKAGLRPGKVEGKAALLPADFLIDEQLIVRRIHHGRDITDHMPFSVIEDWLLEA